MFCLRHSASDPQVLAKAADALSAGDLVNRKVRQYGSWGLMPFAAAIGSVYPASYMRGNRETYHPMETNWPRCVMLFSLELASTTEKVLLLIKPLHTAYAAMVINIKPVPTAPKGAARQCSDTCSHAAGSQHGWARTLHRGSRGGCWASCTRA